MASEVASSDRGQELVERRVEQPDRDREAGHRLEDRLEVALLDREQPVERRAPRALVCRENHLLDDRQPVGGHEHVLGPAEPDALGPELAGLRGILGRVGVRAHAQAPELVGPAEDRPEVLVDRRRDERHGCRRSRGPCRRRSSAGRPPRARRRRAAPCGRRCRSRAPRSRRRRACPCRGRRPRRATSSRRAP